MRTLWRQGVCFFAGLIGYSALGAAPADSVAAAYGTKVKFRENVPLKFPHFELVYTGKRHVSGPKFPRGWWVHDFTARSGKEEQKVTWTAGTGDIAPTRFKINGAAFDLELGYAEKFRQLKADELVVTTRH